MVAVSLFSSPLPFPSRTSLARASAERLDQLARSGALTAVCDGKWVEMPTHLEK
jgi:hypothetical protein